MSKILMFTLVIVVLSWLDGLVNAEEMSTQPTPVPFTEPTPLPTPVSEQNLQPVVEADSEITPEVMLQIQDPAPVHRAALKPEDTGESKQFKAEDSEGNYAFGYVEDHLSGGSFRKEIGDKTGRVEGFYGLRDADGRVRIVAYVADEDGFRADIQTNEPGFEVLDPASTTINKGKPVAVANPLTYDRISGKGEFEQV